LNRRCLYQAKVMKTLLTTSAANGNQAVFAKRSMAGIRRGAPGAREQRGGP
jgi:hypothetical protein